AEHNPLPEALRSLGGQGVLKTAAFGYDGKGQCRIGAGDDLERVWEQYRTTEAVLEGFIDFQRELSVIAVRNPRGDVRCYEAFVNVHANHILDVSVAPAVELDERTSREAQEIG